MADVGWIERLFGANAQRDGQAHALEELATHVDVDGDSAAPAESAPARHAVPDEPRFMLMRALATKILNAHLQNRHQTLFPLTMNFGSLRSDERALLTEAMAMAMLADGVVREEETDAIAESLRTIGGGENERTLLEASLREPRPSSVVLEEIQAANLGALAYAASLLAVDRRQTVNQLYLEYLAARLALPSEVVVSLNRRYVR